MGRLTTSLVSTHNTSIFTVVCFYFGSPDESWASSLDPTSNLLGNRYSKYESSPQGFVRQSCSEFVDLSIIDPNKVEEASPMPDAEALALLKSYNLDILVDLTAHTTGGRIGLSGSHPAGIVVNYLGYPGDSFLCWIQSRV